MSNADAKKYKTLLEKEKDEIVDILEKISDQVNDSDVFQPKVADFGSDVTEFEDEEADEAEEFGRRVGIVEVLTERLRNISAAFARIKLGTYGTCEECNKEIELKVLQVSPSSTQCMECKKKK